MIVNPAKFQAIIIDKRKQEYINEILKIGSKEIKVASQVNFFWKEIDNKLNFEQHINLFVNLLQNNWKQLSDRKGS